MKKIPNRQVHLDFHTSEMIDQVGSKFSAEEFADTLKNANVEAVTLFTRCFDKISREDTSSSEGKGYVAGTGEGMQEKGDKSIFIYNNLLGYPGCSRTSGMGGYR